MSIGNVAACALFSVVCLVACDGDGDSQSARQEPADDAGSEDPGQQEPRCAPDGVGARCKVAGDCAEGLTCKGDFAFERRICTRTCSSDADCPGARCVTGLPNYNEVTLEPRCMQPCGSNADCSCRQSVCDDAAGQTARYCY